MKTHYTIPFFIPHKGCPYKCVFCNQTKITNQRMALPEDVTTTIEKYLSTIPVTAHVETGFFGGTFTGIPVSLQERFLSSVQPYIKNGRIKGIRLSTRPDFIDEQILNFLKQYNVACIELGVQSMSNKVLLAAKRGHTAEDTIHASKLILKKGFALGHQMMVGLPLSSFSDELYTAKCAKDLGVRDIRIYPVIVMKDTELAEMWKRKEYIELSEEDAIRRCAELLSYFEKNRLNVIRCGLHPSEGLLDGSDYLAGPFHPSFRQKAERLIETNNFSNQLFDTDPTIINPLPLPPHSCFARPLPYGEREG